MSIVPGPVGEDAEAMTENQGAVCICGSGAEIAACCGPILDGAPAPTVEALMRSRYAAFATGRLDHIAATNSPSAHARFDRAAAEASARDVEWTRLEIIDVAGGGGGDDTGRVEFRAYFNRLGQSLIHHEAATFVRDGGRWLFEEGQMNPKGSPRRVAHVGRNDPCPCGSGRKYKKCCEA